ncbi:hypothetical protein [Celerinatantimonas sp. MCCC 1A17872]|uniref:hypothetical protein n=1 Tax=Celerinatantimonas sp. MCCC 1A17872 TaxID=3177514 RepID=UPI0038C413E9
MIENIECATLPRQVQELFNLIGSYDSYLLLKRYGGQELYIPQHPERSKLIDFISYTSLHQLSLMYGGTYLSVPTTQKIDLQLRNYLIIEALLSGKTRQEVAKEFCLSIRQISNIKKRNNYIKQVSKKIQVSRFPDMLTC